MTTPSYTPTVLAAALVRSSSERAAGMLTPADLSHAETATAAALVFVAQSAADGFTLTPREIGRTLAHAVAAILDHEAGTPEEAARAAAHFQAALSRLRPDLAGEVAS